MSCIVIKGDGVTLNDVTAALSAYYNGRRPLTVIDDSASVSNQTPGSDSEAPIYLTEQKVDFSNDIIGIKSENNKLRSSLSKKNKELSELEVTSTKALASIQTFHKQQQALFDEFVVLRQRYDEQKAQLVTILWQHCGQHHPDLRHIPVAEDENTFTETDVRVGSFAIGDMLGEGQFATVKTCVRDGTDSREFALKMIKKERITTFQSLKRVSNEIDILRKLKSPFIVSIADVMQTKSKLYIVTEKGGADLFEFFDEHPDGVPEAWAKQIVACVLQAVLYCHDQGICHRGESSRQQVFGRIPFVKQLSRLIYFIYLIACTLSFRCW